MGMQVMITVPSQGWSSSIHGLQFSNKSKHVWEWLGQTYLLYSTLADVLKDSDSCRFWVLGA